VLRGECFASSPVNVELGHRSRMTCCSESIVTRTIDTDSHARVDHQWLKRLVHPSEASIVL
jgi:hypothetical protein